MKYKNFMPYALKEAEKAFNEGEVPVGCVIVKDGEIIARAHNGTEKANNALCHAEIIAINEACKALGNKYLTDCEMYVTLEMCPMCAGAVINSKISRVYIGASDKKGGAAGGKINVFEKGLFNHMPEIYYGISEGECANLLKTFFESKR